MAKKEKKEKKVKKSTTKGTYKEYKYMTMQETWHKIKDNPVMKDKVNYGLYKKIMNTLSTEILEEVLMNPMGFQLPEHLGMFQMIGLKRPSVGPYTDLGLLAQTDGYNYTIRHLKGSHTRIHNLVYYNFTLSDLAFKLVTRRIRKDDFFHLQKFNSRKQMYMANDRDNPEERIIQAMFKKDVKTTKAEYREMVSIVKENIKNKKEDDNKG
jgi:hypothetical protein